MNEIDLFAPKPSVSRTRDVSRRINFDRVLGQPKVKLLLKKAIHSQRIAKAYLFYGPEGCGKDAMAIELAKVLNCLSNQEVPCHSCRNCRLIGQFTHPDFQFVFAAPSSLKEEDYVKHVQAKSQNHYLRSSYSETATILIDHIRALKKTASMKIYQGKQRVFLISEADRMNQEASNSLLKLLEEPPEHLVLILTTARLDQILPTILSRCQVIKFSSLGEEVIQKKLIENQIDPQRASVIARLAMGSYQKAQNLLQEDYQALRQQAWKLLMATHSTDDLEKLDLVSELTSGKDRGQIKELFLLALHWLRDVQVLRTMSPDRGKSTLYNSDHLEKLQELSNAFKEVNLEKTMLETENCIDLVEKNVYINLVLINFLNHLFDI